MKEFTVTLNTNYEKGTTKVNRAFPFIYRLNIFEDRRYVESIDFITESFARVHANKLKIREVAYEDKGKLIYD